MMPGAGSHTHSLKTPLFLGFPKEKQWESDLLTRSGNYKKGIDRRWATDIVILKSELKRRFLLNKIEDKKNRGGHSLSESGLIFEVESNVETLF